jgi:threonine synthase
MLPRMPNVTHLTCSLCGRRHEDGPDTYFCPDCGLTGILEVHYDLDAIRPGFRERLAAAPRGIWRYIDLLPLNPSPLPALTPGDTPQLDFPALAAEFGLAGLRVKDEGRNPSASFKDRASAVGVVRAVQFGKTRIACASTGNAASSTACFAAHLGLPATIFVPATAPEAKVAQLRVFGAQVLLVEGDYEKTWDLCQTISTRMGWYNRNCAVNPYLVEGKKTGGLELAEQWGDDVPDWLAISVGDGCTLAGIWKGLREMHALGVIPRLPRLLAVQAAGARPLCDSFERGDEVVHFGPANSLADSIAVGAPRNGVRALRAVRESGGTFISVEDSAIAAAGFKLAARTGIFGEPAGVASLAGVLAAREAGTLGPKDAVCVMVTGSGLKDVRGGTAAAPPARRVSADPELFTP